MRIASVVVICVIAGGAPGCARSVPSPFPPGLWNIPNGGSSPRPTLTEQPPSTLTVPPPSTGDTGSTPLPFDPEPALEPSVRITGVAGSHFAQEFSLLPRYSTDPSAIFVVSGVFVPYGLPQTLILPGMLPRGTYNALDVWDGSSEGRYTFSAIAGDVNDDGHLDIWGDGLFLGPFLGRAIDWDNDWVAKIDYNGYPASFGDIDIDGDGNEDVGFGLGWGVTADVFFGPFSGEITAGPGNSRFGDFQCSDGWGATLLRDHLGPGHHAIAVGTGGDASCHTFLYDLMQPRGAHLHESDALLETDIGGSTTPWWNYAGDLNSDGFSDVVYGDPSFGEVWKGPAQGLSYYHPDTLVFDTVNGYVTFPLGDLNGDGVFELVAKWANPNVLGEYTHVLLFSPFTDPVDVTGGVVLGDWTVTSTWDFGRHHADLDGDGLEDLVDAMPLNLPTTPPELFNAGELHIWYGADLLAAEEARTASATPRRTR